MDQRSEQRGKIVQPVSRSQHLEDLARFELWSPPATAPTHLFEGDHGGRGVGCNDALQEDPRLEDGEQRGKAARREVLCVVGDDCVGSAGHRCRDDMLVVSIRQFVAAVEHLPALDEGVFEDDLHLLHEATGEHASGVHIDTTSLELQFLVLLQLSEDGGAP